MKLVVAGVAALSVVALLISFRERFEQRGDADPPSAVTSDAPPQSRSDDVRPVAAAAKQGSAPPRRDGSWNVTMQLDMPAAPQAPAPITFSQCVTKQDADDPAKLIPLAGRDDETPMFECQIADQKFDGAKVSWTTRCEGLNPMTGTGEFVYAADRYTGTMKVVTKRNGEPVTMTMKYSGTRQGDCVK